MKLNYKLGELIRNVDVKNKDLHCNNLKGLSMTKEFRASTSNIVGTDLSKYKIVAYKQFACDFMSAIRVHKMPIAFNSEMEEILVSPAYAVFEVIDENIILPEYLMMWFRRSEFDRYADFRSDAAIRGGYGWNELCETEIKLLSLEEQRKIVQAYKTITDRIELKKKINDNLEAQAEALFTLKVQNACEMRSLGSFGTVVTGKTPSTDVSEFYGNDVPFVKTPDMHGNTFITSSENSLSTLGAESQANKYLPKNTVIVACIGANAGEVAITSFRSQTNQQINAIISEYPCFLYLSIKAHTTELRALGEGSSTMININKTSFENYEIPTLKDDDILLLEKQLSRIFAPVLLNLREIDKLNEIKDILVSRISC